MVSRSSDNECSIGVKLLSEIIRAMSSAYMYFFDLVCVRSAVYIEEERSQYRSLGNTILQESAFALLFAQVQHKAA